MLFLSSRAVAVDKITKTQYHLPKTKDLQEQKSSDSQVQNSQMDNTNEDLNEEFIKNVEQENAELQRKFIVIFLVASIGGGITIAILKSKAKDMKLSELARLLISMAFFLNAKEEPKASQQSKQNVDNPSPKLIVPTIKTQLQSVTTVNTSNEQPQNAKEDQPNVKKEEKKIEEVIIVNQASNHSSDITKTNQVLVIEDIKKPKYSPIVTSPNGFRRDPMAEKKSLMPHTFKFFLSAVDFKLSSSDSVVSKVQRINASRYAAIKLKNHFFVQYAHEIDNLRASSFERRIQKNNYLLALKHFRTNRSFAIAQARQDSYSASIISQILSRQSPKHAQEQNEIASKFMRIKYDFLINSSSDVSVLEQENKVKSRIDALKKYTGELNYLKVRFGTVKDPQRRLLSLIHCPNKREINSLLNNYLESEHIGLEQEKAFSKLNAMKISVSSFGKFIAGTISRKEDFETIPLPGNRDLAALAKANLFINFDSLPAAAFGLQSGLDEALIRGHQLACKSFEDPRLLYIDSEVSYLQCYNAAYRLLESLIQIVDNGSIMAQIRSKNIYRCKVCTKAFKKEITECKKCAREIIWNFSFVSRNLSYESSGTILEFIGKLKAEYHNSNNEFRILCQKQGLQSHCMTLIKDAKNIQEILSRANACFNAVLLHTVYALKKSSKKLTGNSTSQRYYHYSNV